MSNVNSVEQTDGWLSGASNGVVPQLAGLVNKRFPGLRVSISTSGRAFRGAKSGASPGVWSCSADLKDDVVPVKLELLPPSAGARLPLPALAALEEITKDRRLIVTRDDRDADLVSLWLELIVSAQPLNVPRESLFLEELDRADTVARALQAELPVLSLDERAITKLYEGVAAVLAPINPCPLEDAVPVVLEFAREAADYLRAACSVAVAARYPIISNYCMSAIALAAKEHGQTIGVLRVPAIHAKSLLEIAKDAPGPVVVPANRVRLGTSQYEIGGEMEPLLSSLAENGTPAVFTGDFGQLQAIFHGGQGGASDPLCPIVREAPEGVPLDCLVRFAVRTAARLGKGISRRAEDELTAETLDAVRGVPESECLRILPAVAMRVVDGYERGPKREPKLPARFAKCISGLKQTLTGLPVRPRTTRDPSVQERYLQVVPELLAYLQERIVGQDQAIQQVADRLWAECLTRPLHQPLRFCAQGLPGVGKSQVVAYLAELLGVVPYAYIDAASMPDAYTATTQLLGGGRGLVGSHLPGRLEVAAKSPAGAVVEVADLDHAPPTVQQPIADIFLQMLETGEAQSGTGDIFSCANLVFVFTMNLPHGQDEAVRQRMGFHCAVSPGELSARVSDEIKRCLSGAFLSRVGTPILFEPLDASALATIAVRAVKSALRSAVDRTGMTINRICVEDDLGAKLVASMPSGVDSFGVRGLFEHCRLLVARAFRETDNNSSTDGLVHVRWSSGGGVRITTT